MFAWMDEWFKPTWIVLYLEVYGIHSGGDLIPTRQLWHNITSAEQNFGLLTFDREVTPANVTYLTDNPSDLYQRLRLLTIILSSFSPLKPQRTSRRAIL